MSHGVGIENRIISGEKKGLDQVFILNNKSF
jgi:hypothetical protein